MNHVQFSVRTELIKDADDVEAPWPVVDILIDGRDLRELVRSFELSFAAAEGHPELAGQYGAPTADEVLPPSRHFWGEPSERLYVYDDKVSVFGCSCRCPMCWPLLVRIEANARTVTWSDFEQPHRRGNTGSPWRYDHFGPFRFSRRQYDDALQSAAKDLARWKPR